MRITRVVPCIKSAEIHALKHKFKETKLVNAWQEKGRQVWSCMTTTLHVQIVLGGLYKQKYLPPELDVELRISRDQ